MLVFVDESGDTGYKFDRNSSPYFVVTAVIFQSEEEATKISKCIDELKAELGKPAAEFHFTNTDDRTRQKFFDAIRKYDFQVCAVIYNKKKMPGLQGKHNDFLSETFGTLIEVARDLGLIEAANIKYDEAGGSAFQKKLSSGLLARVNGTETEKYVKQFDPQSSTGNNLIQLADMICGAIARPYNKPQRKESDYLETIKRRIHTVLEWP